MCDMVKVTLIVFSLYILYVGGRYQKYKGMFYLFLWTDHDRSSYEFIQSKSEMFIQNDCAYRNCFIINTTTYLSPITKYDALLFGADALHAKPDMTLPDLRSRNQKYILFSFESTAKHPIAAKYNNFFNWTWTYKVDADISFKYITIRQKNGRVIGPNQNMHWIPTAQMKKTSLNIVQKLRKKTMAAAWIVKKCRAKNMHTDYVRELREKLRKYEMIVSIFGPCGLVPCPRDDVVQCYGLIAKDYYFYLAFEDSWAEDYVTDQLLIALNNYAVPIVFGGANYTRLV